MADYIMENEFRWRETPLVWGVLVACVAALSIPFYDAVDTMVACWLGWPEYSHGILLPFIALFLIWQKKNELEKIEFKGSIFGSLTVLFGILLYAVGELSSLYVVVQYAFWVSLVGLAWSYLGSRAMIITWAAWLILFLMIPLPNFITWNLSAKLQLISSQIGVFVIRLFGISVFLEGNVIDLGSMKLQVVEACSGLRYLFPLMTLGVIIGYFFSAPVWQRVFIFVSSMPITVLMNSFRIGLIGVTVEYWGTSMAEGVLHDFEGWVVFMTSFAVMLFEMWLMLKLSGSKQSLSQAFAIELPTSNPPNQRRSPRKLPATLLVSLLIFTLAIPLSKWLPFREETIPQRVSFIDFPRKISDWVGTPMPLEREYIETLHFNDYLLMDYRNPISSSLTFYVAWYDSQKKGRSVHSPKTCLPGGGWRLSEFDQKELPDLILNNQPLQVNRAIIQKDDQKQIVYYWFQQRGRIITNEYAAKFYLLWDGITQNRSDGALVRIVAPVPASRSVDSVEKDMHAFLSDVIAKLPKYVPN